MSEEIKVGRVRGIVEGGGVGGSAGAGGDEQVTQVSHHKKK